MVQDLPSTRVPVIRSFMRLMVRSRVDFPQPDGPMRAVILRASNAMLMPFTARNFE